MQIFKKTKHIVMSYVVITLGLAMYTLGWCIFMLPSQIVGGGVSGMSSTLYYALFQPNGIEIPIGVMNLIINAILVVIGFKTLGAKFGANTIYGIIMSSFFFVFWQQIIHVEQFVDVSEFGNFMCAIVGGVMLGVGIGLTFSMGGNSGGTDIIALIISKYHNISPGKVILYLDLVIIGCSYLVSHKVENVILGYIVMMVMTYVLDMVIDGNKQTYQIMVFSSKNNEIGAAVTSEVGRGATLLNAEGCYSHKEQQVLIVMAHKTDKPLIMQIIHRIDSDAFISVSKTQGVYGRNFEKLKM